MSEDATAAAEQPAPDAETSTPEQPEVDWKARAREWEKRAKQNKDAADELARIQESQKTAEQRASEALAAAERRAAEAENRLMRFDVAREKGIPDWADDLTGSTPDEIAASAERIVRRLSAVTSPKTPPPDPNQGRQSKPGTSTAELFAAALGDF